MTKNSDLDFKATDNLENLETDIIKPKTTTNEIIHKSVSNNNEPILTKEDITSEPEDAVLIATLKEEVENQKKQLATTNDRMMRIAADSQNASKQNQLDLQEARKQSKKSLVKNITPFLTTLVLSFDFAPDNEETSKFVQQLKNALVKLNNDLDNSQVKMIVPIVGELFDPKTMQALNATEDESPKVKNIASVGCIVDDQVIQAASVLI